MTTTEPGTPEAPGLRGTATGSAGNVQQEARLQTLHARWQQFAEEYAAAQERNDQEVMTNLRGLMILIKREIGRLGGTMPDFPVGGEHHLADL
jgi:hypothetical protein